MTPPISFSTAIYAYFVNNPLVLAAMVISFIYAIISFRQSQAPPPKPIKPPEPVVLKNFTPSTLSKFDGKDEDTKIYMGVNGKVFDVTRGRGFYGPEGPYGNFAGRDASRGLAKHSFDKEMLTPLDQPLDKLEDLNAEEKDSLREWEMHFDFKYIHVGYLVNEGEENGEIGPSKKTEKKE
ncbi:cytochrome b5-like heme/steroid binding domain-containing protein [Paraphysoderma sedebokerense]|nr:cytochrome b5-like heme/steroid binding domain-containing protein [Paraphysoderma sedebokerense]